MHLLGATLPWRVVNTRSQTIADRFSALHQATQVRSLCVLEPRPGHVAVSLEQLIHTSVMHGWMTHSCRCESVFHHGPHDPLVHVQPPPLGLDVVVLPVLAIDPSGHFVADGSGRFDAALRSRPRFRRIAVAFDFQLVPEVPVTAGDESVDWIVTDSRVFETRAPRACCPSRVAMEDRRVDVPGASPGPVGRTGDRFVPDAQAHPGARGS